MPVHDDVKTELTTRKGQGLATKRGKGVHDDVKTQMTTQMYLKTIYLLRQEGQATTLTRLAETLHVAPPTALAMARRLTKSGLVSVGRRKELLLTEEGETVARAILRRHHLAERLLGDLIGVPWHDTHEEACRLEHAISPAIEERLFAALGFPNTCPHGNAIDPEAPADRTITLDQATVGSAAVIRGVHEMAEMDHSFLTYLDDHGLTPGAVLAVARHEPSIDILFVCCGDQELALSLRAASRIRVEAAEGIR